MVFHSNMNCVLRHPHRNTVRNDDWKLLHSCAVRMSVNGFYSLLPDRSARNSGQQLAHIHHNWTTLVCTIRVAEADVQPQVIGASSRDGDAITPRKTLVRCNRPAEPESSETGLSPLPAYPRFVRHIAIRHRRDVQIEPDIRASVVWTRCTLDPAIVSDQAIEGWQTGSRSGCNRCGRCRQE